MGSRKTCARKCFTVILKEFLALPGYRDVNRGSLVIEKIDTRDIS